MTQATMSRFFVIASSNKTGEDDSLTFPPPSLPPPWLCRDLDTSILRTTILFVYETTEPLGGL